MAERISFTEARIKKLAPEPGRVRTVYDAEVQELALRIQPSGSVRWYVIGRINGTMKFASLGPWPRLSVETARERAREDLVKLARGVDPLKERQDAKTKAKGGKVPMLEALSRRMDAMGDRGRSPQHMAELKRVATEANAAGIKDLAEPSIAAKADKWLRSLDVSDMTRHRYRAHLIAIGKEALRWWPPAVLGREPFLALAGHGARMPAPPVFDPAEAALLASDEALVLDGGMLWAFLLYTGCRYREAAWARWDRIDLDRRTFHVIPPDAEERKSGAAVKRDKARTVELQPELVELLRSRAGVGFLFDEKWRKRPHIRNVFDFRAHLERLTIPLGNRRIHALRHTHACLAIAAGVDSMRLRLSMGHAGPEMQAHYGSQAMRWRGVLAEWDGNFQLRNVSIGAKSLERGA